MHMVLALTYFSFTGISYLVVALTVCFSFINSTVCFSFINVQHLHVRKHVHKTLYLLPQWLHLLSSMYMAAI